MQTHVKVSLVLTLLMQQLSAQHPEVPNFNAHLQGYNTALLTWDIPVIADETLFFEGFESGNIPATWTVIDNDSDGEKWEIHPSSWSAAHSGNYSVASYSWFNGNVLTPDNWLISPEINVPANAQLEYWVSGISPTYSHEHYQVRVSTSGVAISDFSHIIIDETLPNNNNTWQQRVAALSAFAGQTIRLAFVHNNSTNVFALKIDDISVKVYARNNPVLTGFTIKRKLPGQPTFQIFTTTNETTTVFSDNLTTEGRTQYTIKANYSDGESSNESAMKEVRFIDWYPVTTLLNGTLQDGQLALTWNHLPQITKTLTAESFEAPTDLSDWTLFDFDGDFEKWEKHTATSAYHGTQSMASYSWFNGSVLTPNNWAVSMRQPLTGGFSANLSWFVSTISTSYPVEHYQLRVSNHMGTDTSNFAVLFEETLSASDNTWKRRSLDISDYLTDTISLAFVHNQSTNQFALKIDSVSLRSYNSVVRYKIMASQTESGSFTQFGEVDAEDFGNTGNVTGSYEETGAVWIQVIPVFADGGTAVLNQTYKIDPTSAIRAKTSEFTVFPNPATERVFIKLGDKISGQHSTLTIRNSAGVEILTRNFLGHNTEIPLTECPAGVYTIHVKTNTGIHTEKLVVLR